MNKTKILKLKNRKKIYDYIYENPGLHLRHIIKDIDLSEGTIRYHLNYLVDHEFVIKYKKNGYTRFYVSQSNSPNEKNIISYLRNENTRSIILFYFCYTCGSIAKVCRVLNKDKKDISFYIKNLINDDILEIAPSEGSEVLINFKKCKKKSYSKYRGEKVYRLKNPYILNEILFSLKNKYLDDGTTDKILGYLQCIYEQKDKRSETIQSDNESITSVEDLFFKLFPIPFCA